MAIDQELENILAFKEARLHAHRTLYSKIIKKNDYALDLQSTTRNDNDFHVSHLDRYIMPVGAQTSSELHLIVLVDTDEWEVDHRFDTKQRYRKLHELIQWGCYNPIHSSWEPGEHRENARDLVDEFHCYRPDWPLE
jgi:hypothetical protein